MVDSRAGQDGFMYRIWFSKKILVDEEKWRIIKSTWQLNIKYSAALMYMLASVVGIKKKSLSQQMVLNIQQSMAGKWEPFMIAYTTETNTRDFGAWCK
ncbi:hypothetical protein K7X08_010347 [Anisodus acutangulus]|uniref:Uncharacterized protein n=1 Tax=Anisodus acutangulus TaxID=402998 RepID=A0A9Q1N2J6_9SOLA|nr:hypothetical protein K7X08_010347 [Anisodus acutangulus]